MNASPSARILFVCLGNICRSPTAEAVFRALARQRGWDQQLHIDSCGTGGWHAGQAPDPRAVAAAAERGYDLTPLRARQLQWQDFFDFDRILVMDQANLEDVRRAAPLDYSGEIALFLDYAPGQPVREVPDPYHGREDGFARVLDLVEAASEGLLQDLEQRDRR